jgi:hypothetical protein
VTAIQAHSLVDAEVIVIQARRISDMHMILIRARPSIDPYLPYIRMTVDEHNIQLYIIVAVWRRWGTQKDVQCAPQLSYPVPR